MNSLNHALKVFICSHTQTEMDLPDYNPVGHDNCNASLTSYGILQAKAVGNYLKEIIPNDAIEFHITPSVRCYQTTLNILPFLQREYNCKVLINPKLEARRISHLGKTKSQIEEYVAKKNVDDYTARLGDSENGRELMSKLAPFTKYLISSGMSSDHPGSMVLVTQRGVIKALLSNLFVLGKEGFNSFPRLENGSILELTIGNEGQVYLNKSSSYEGKIRSVIKEYSPIYLCNPEKQWAVA
jgi:broad specificity phosphatase PhoE